MLLGFISIRTVRGKILQSKCEVRSSSDTTHGPRSALIANRHVGDLGNLTTDANGAVAIDFTDGIIQLYNATQSIMNRTAIVHLMRDDGGMGGFSDSAATG